MRRYLWWVAAMALLASEFESSVANGQGARRDAIASVGRSTGVQRREHESAGAREQARASTGESYRRLRGAATAEEPNLPESVAISDDTAEAATASTPVGVRDVVVSWGDGESGGDVDSPEEGGESRLSAYSSAEVSARWGEDPHEDTAEEKHEHHASEVDGTGEESVPTRGRVAEGMVPWEAGEPQLPTYADPEEPSPGPYRSEDTFRAHDELQDAEAEDPEQESESTRERLADDMVPWADGGPQLPTYSAAEEPTPEPRYREGSAGEEHDQQYNVEAEEQEMVPTREQLTDGMVPWDGGPQLPAYTAAEEPTPGPHRRDSIEGEDPDMERGDDTEESVSVEYTASPTYGEDIEHTAYRPGVEEHDGQLVSATGDIMDVEARWDQDDCYPCELPTSIPRRHNGTEHKDSDYISRGGSVTEDVVTWDNLEHSEPVYPAPTEAPTPTPSPTATYATPTATYATPTEIEHFGEDTEVEDRDGVLVRCFNDGNEQWDDAAATVTDAKTSTSTSDGSTSDLGAGAIAGIIIGCVVLVAVVVGALLFRQRSLARQREANLFADLSDTGGALETDYAAM
ncbi:hypothetical protein BBJ28_00006484 [Nothophytophthora sp. Chile5]|nr:hypothetical protein BBJ28_00006484 [Nothophytophthora sp. Chile5]